MFKANRAILRRALEQLEEGGVRGEGAASWPIERGHFKTAELEADLATAKPASVKARMVNDEMKRSTGTLIDEMQRNTGEQK